MITIRHKAGLLAGTSQQIEARSDRITFGRDSATCDVVFPNHETLVAHRHFALVRKPSGDWTFDLFGKPFVAMDGQPVGEAEAVRNGATIELGRHGGPSFVIELDERRAASGDTVTQTQEKVQSLHSAAARTRRYAAAGLLLALVLGGGALALYALTRGESARLSEALARLAEEQRRAAAQTISTDVKEKLIKGAYLVIMRSADGLQATATATPIGPDVLGTNAHVAAAFLNRKQGERFFVRAPGHDGAVHEVIEARKHPSWEALDDFLGKDPILVPGSAKPWLSSSKAFSYDVGTLHLAKGSNLSPILELAGREELEKLAPGFPLAIAGYPTEDISLSEIQPFAPTPTFGVGIVTAMTNMFGTPTDFEHRFLIHHNLPTTGGSSGSPLVGPSGRIVGLNNAGHVSSGVPSGALINYGQRADMLADLLAGSGSALIESQRAYWTKMTAGFRRGMEYFVPFLLSGMKPRDGMTAEPVSREKYAMTAADRTSVTDAKGKKSTVREQTRTLQVKAGRQYAFIAYAEEKKLLRLYLFVGKELVDQNELPYWFPFVSHAAAQDGTVELVVRSDDEDVTYTLFQYVWTGSSSLAAPGIG